MMPIPKHLLGAMVLMRAASVGAQDAPATPQGPPAAALFPFVMPWDDASPSVVSVAHLNPAPLDASRRIRVQDGHFYDSTGHRVRFVGANFTFGANFPDKPDAEKVAARMHKLGFNCVRLHHMDYYKAPSGIWDKNFPDMQHLDADQLDRLDYLLAQFKKNGIYADLNLHVSRAFTQADGFPDTEKLPRLGKVTAFFEPRMIELQKNYARDLLTHLNPYTGLKWADDPVIALVEINNEDSLLGAARGQTLQELPAFYGDQLVAGWNKFLKSKYGTTAKLEAAWSQGHEPLGDNILRNARFSDDTKNWNLEKHAPGEVIMTAEDVADAPFEGRALHFKVSQLSSEQWHLQTSQTGLDLKDDGRYALSFWAKSDVPRSLEVYAKLDQDPWRDLGFRQIVRLTPAWKQFTLPVSPTGTVPSHNRLTWVLGNAVGEVWLGDVLLRAGDAPVLQAGQTLESGLPLPAVSNSREGQDYVAYLMQVERDYAQEMRAYIQQTLGCAAPVACSQASYGGLGGVAREAGMDWVDMHAYWQHPNFPHKAWDAKDWTIKNTSMLTDSAGGTLSNLAQHRVEGMPFTVSEYNHPAPNDYSAETLPFIAAYAAQQDWDGFFLFEYNGNRTNWKDERIKGFFSSDSHPGKMAFMPLAATLFLRGDLQPQANSATLLIPRAQLTTLSARYGSVGNLWQDQGISKRALTDKRLALRMVDGDGPISISAQMDRTAPGAPANRLTWDASGALTMDAPAAKIVLGLRENAAKIELNDLTVEAQTSQAQPFLALGLTALDARPVAQSASLLLTLMGRVENTGMGWNETRTSVSNQWGQGPVQTEGVPVMLSMATGAKTAQVFALDPTGSRLHSVPCNLENGRLTFSIDPKRDQSAWFEIVAAQPQ